MTVTEDADLDVVGYSRADSKKAWVAERVLPIAWVIAWRSTVIFIATTTTILVTVNLLQDRGPFRVDKSFAPLLFIFLLPGYFILLCAFNAGVEICRNSRDARIQVIGNGGTQFEDLVFKQVTRIQWLVLWRMVITKVPILVPFTYVSTCGVYFQDAHPVNTIPIMTIPILILIPVFYLIIQAALRKRYRGFHLMPASTAKNKTENQA